jgi:hypothetical protein
LELYKGGADKAGPSAEEISRINALLMASGGSSDARLTRDSSSNPSSSPAPITRVGDGVDINAVVALNAFGDRFDDPVAAACLSDVQKRNGGGGGGGSGGLGGGVDRVVPHVGLWPQFALINHSCLPNAIHFTVGRYVIQFLNHKLMTE